MRAAWTSCSTWSSWSPPRFAIDLRRSAGKLANLEQVIEASLADLGGAATALRKLPNDEAAQVAGWYVDIAKAVAAAAKTVTTTEQETIDKIAALFAIPSA